MSPVLLSPLARTPKGALLLAIGTLAVLVGLTSLVRAQMPGGASNPAVQAAIAKCQPDRDKFCASVWPGGGRIVRCLMERADALTPACRTALNDARAAGATLPR